MQVNKAPHCCGASRISDAITSLTALSISLQGDASQRLAETCGGEAKYSKEYGGGF